MSVTSPNVRDRLSAIRTEITDLRQQAAKARGAAKLAREHGEAHGEAVAQLKLDELTGAIDVKRELELTILRSISGVASYQTESFLADPATVQQMEALASSTRPIGAMQLGPVVGRDELVALISSGAWRSGARAASGDVVVPDGARQAPFYGVVPQARRALRLLDLIPTAPMDGRSFEYAIESGDIDTAAETVEGSIKPTAELELTDGEVTAKTIAHFLKLRRQQLADLPALDQIVRGRLTYGVMRRVENQIVSGDGTGENLTGILNTTGVGEVEFDADVPLADLPLDALVTTQLSDSEPDAVVINPLDLAAMLKALTDDGHRLDSGGAFALPVPTILWGLPAITSRVMPQGSALVGAFAQGCTLFIREGVNVLMSDSDQDDFIRNRVTLLGEARVGLAIWRPSAFTIVRLAAGA